MANKPVEDMSIEELESLMGNPSLVIEETPPEEVPAPAEAPPAETPPEEAPAETPPAEEPPPAEAPKEPDYQELMRRQDALRLRMQEDETQAQKAHTSRLAGKIGFLEQKIKQLTARPTEQQPEWSGQPDPAVQSLYSEIERLKEERRNDLRDRAIASEIATFGNQFREAKYTPEEINAAAAKFNAQYEEANTAETPETARELVRAALARTATEIESRRLEAAIAKATERKVESQAKLEQSKRAAGISGSGGRSAPQPKPKSYDDMSIAELDKLLIEMHKR